MCKALFRVEETGGFKIQNTVHGWRLGVRNDTSLFMYKTLTFSPNLAGFCPISDPILMVLIFSLNLEPYLKS